MPAKTTNYQCPACTGPLHFAADSGNLECEYCASTFTVQQVEEFYAEKEAKAAAAHAAEQASNVGEDAMGFGGAATAVATLTQEQTTQTEHWGTQKLQTDWGVEGAQMCAYNCTSCGAEIMCDATTAATSCLYCGNPTIVPGQFAGALKPDYIIPFKIDKEGAKEALKKHCKGKFLLPKQFTKENNIEKMTGAYVPFWLFDGSVNVDVRYKASDSSSVIVGDYRITTTKHFDVHRAGVVEFSDIPVDASSKMPDIYMESIEPFDYSELKPFSTAYMPGYLADKYDMTIEQCSQRADSRAQQSALKMMHDSVDHSKVVETTKQVNISKGDVQYAMAPVWMLTTRYKNKPYLFALNGQTGKFVGELPCDWGKFWRLVLGLTTGLATVFYILWSF